MEMLKNNVKCFSNFPPDIWAYLVRYLAGEQIGRLKMSGSASLWSKLRLPTVVKSIKLGEDYFIFKSWPAFLNELPTLEEVVIHSCSIVWWSKMGLKLDSIPSTVKKLRLSGVVCTSAAFFVDNYSRAINLDEQLPNLQELDLKSMESDDYTWMARCPKSLTKLKINCWDGQTELPSSLTHFSAYKTEIRDYSIEVKLPPGLESFRTFDLVDMGLLIPVAESTDVISLLPAGLTALKGDATLPSSVWPFLPKTLKKLSFAGSESSSTIISKTVVDPITRKVRSITSCPFETLPKSITHLKILFNDDFEPVYCGPPSEPALSSYFPPHLTFLSLSGVYLSPEAANLFPASLVDLRLENMCEQISKYLPKGLTRLIATRVLMSPNLIKDLPKSLTSLHLVSAARYFPWINYSNGERIELNSNIPEFANHQTCLSTIDWKDYKLPARLTSLKLSYYWIIEDTFLMDQPFPNLLELNLRESKHFTNLIVPLLNRHLTSLDLASAQNISGECFPFLPRSLTWLNLDASSSIFDSEIQHLPRTLKVIELRSATHLTESCIQYLPRSLEQFHLQKNEIISSASVPDFPPLLRSAQLFRTATFALWYIERGKIVMLPT